MASKKEMLRVDLEARWQILIIAKEVLKFAHYFDTPETHDEHNYINRHRHLIFIKWSLWRLAIIELSKLFSASENQKFNMLKLLKKVSKGGEYKTLKLDEITLKKWQTRFDLLIEPINEINRLRDKFYAHTEKNPFEIAETTLNFEACYELVQFAEDIIRGLSHLFLQHDFIVLTPYFQSNSFDFIKTLAAIERANLEQIAKENNMIYTELTGNP